MKLIVCEMETCSHYSAKGFEALLYMCTFLVCVTAVASLIVTELDLWTSDDNNRPLSWRSEVKNLLELAFLGNV